MPKYLVGGVILGLIFVLIGTELGTVDLPGQFTLSSALGMQASQPLLWVLDFAPLVLGYFGILIHRREAALHALSRDLRAIVEEQTGDLTYAVSFAEAIFENSGHAILVSDTTGNLTHTNPASLRMLGYSADELIGSNVIRLHDPEEILRLTKRTRGTPDFVGLTRLMRRGRPMQADVVFTRKDGRRITMAVTASPQYIDGEIVGYFEIGIDVTREREQAGQIAAMAEELAFLNSLLERQHEELAQANAQLVESALVDDLTGVNNKRHFAMRIENMILACSREGLPVSLIIFDVDKFKDYNDVFGHLAGDEVLKAIGEELRTVCRPGDFPARIGGEEFAVIMPLTRSRAACEVAQRLRAKIESRQTLRRKVTVSIGVSSTRPGVETPDALFVAADLAMYEAKHAGRNRVEVAPGLESAA